MWQQPAGLITVLLNPAARWDEQDDAAMDLAAYDEPEAEAALLRRAGELARNESWYGATDVAEACGEALATIWCRQGRFPALAFEHLRGAALSGARAVLEARRPDWLADWRREHGSA